MDSAAPQNPALDAVVEISAAVDEDNAPSTEAPPRASDGPGGWFNFNFGGPGWFQDVLEVRVELRGEPAMVRQHSSLHAAEACVVVVQDSLPSDDTRWAVDRQNQAKQAPRFAAVWGQDAAHA